MTNSITILSNSPILQENRQDPITGDLIQEGDKVVICASCKSAFLEGSWKYLGEKHCNQTETLSQIPAKQNFKFVKKLKQLEQVIFSAEMAVGNTTLVLSIIFGMISFIFSMLVFADIIPQEFLYTIGVFVLITLLNNTVESKGIEVKETAIYVKKGFGRKKRYPISKLKKIDVVYYNGFHHEVDANNPLFQGQTMANELTISVSPTLRLKEGWFPLDLNFSEYDFNKNRDKFVDFLNKISYVLPVNLSTDDNELIHLIREKENKLIIRKDLEGLRYFFGKYYRGKIPLS